MQTFTLVLCGYRSLSKCQDLTIFTNLKATGQEFSIYKPVATWVNSGRQLLLLPSDRYCSVWIDLLVDVVCYNLKLCYFLTLTECSGTLRSDSSRLRPWMFTSLASFHIVQRRLYSFLFDFSLYVNSSTFLYIFSLNFWIVTDCNDGILLEAFILLALFIPKFQANANTQVGLLWFQGQF